VPPLTEDAFGDLYRRTMRPLWAYVYRVVGNAADADDIVQDAFCRLLRADIAALSAEDQRRYLFRVAGNLVTDRWRRAEREQAWRAGAGPEAATLPEAPDDGVTKIFEVLKPRERALLWLAYVEQWNHAEIAGALRLRQGSVKVLLARARARLRDLLRADGRPART
jgi:RNA polymerase sigma-70 factor (ECF subfamily)